MPSKLPYVYEKNSHEDLVSKLGLKIAEKTLDYNQSYHDLIMVVQQALGGKSSSNAQPQQPSKKDFPQNAAEFEAKFNRLFGPK